MYMYRNMTLRLRDELSVWDDVTTGSSLEFLNHKEVTPHTSNYTCIYYVCVLHVHSTYHDVRAKVVDTTRMSRLF